MKGTKTSLFLVELMLALLLFAFCAAICVQIFYASGRRVREAEALSRAVFIATEAAELYKASGGDLEKTAENYDRLSHADPYNGTLTVYCDENRNAALIPSLSSQFPSSPYGYILVVSETGGGSASVTVRESGEFSAPGEARDIFSIDVKAVSADG
ncbi:MAG: hypothetical protein LBD92_08475 [Oscillospiraceae bacterium]|jgi:type II secretory pathway pseudopilin PulG|nr:hypothetical protein [Oscillospiraceae bacterium]